MKIAQKLGLLVGALLAAVLVTILVLSAQVSTTSSEYNKLIKEDIQQRSEPVWRVSPFPSGGRSPKNSFRRSAPRCGR